MVLLGSYLLDNQEFMMLRDAKRTIKHARGKLSEEGRGMEHSLGWPVQQLAGPGGVITCAKDLVS